MDKEKPTTTYESFSHQPDDAIDDDNNNIPLPLKSKKHPRRKKKRVCDVNLFKLGYERVYAMV